MAEALKMALAPRLGPARAAEVVEHACAEAARRNLHLRQALAAEPDAAALPQSELDALFDPTRYLGASGAFIDRALAAHGALAQQEARGPARGPA